MEVRSPKGPCRKRRHRSHGTRRGRDDTSRKHLLKEFTDTRKTANCYITQNRLTMRMGLFNKGKASDVIARTDGRGDKGETDKCERRWPKVSLYEGQATTFELLHSKESRIVSSSMDENRMHPADLLSGNLTISPGIEKLSLFLTEHINPMSIMPSGYLQRAKNRLREQYKAALQKMEEEKENLDCHAQMEPGSSHAFRRTQLQQHNAPLKAIYIDNTEDAAAFWWSSSSSAGAKRFHVPPASASMLPPPHRDMTGRSSSSAQNGSTKEFWLAAGGGSMHHYTDVSMAAAAAAEPLLNITKDPKSLRTFNDLVYQPKQGCSHLATSVPLSGFVLPSFLSDNPASGPSSSEWTVDLDHSCLRYINQSTRKNSNVPYYHQEIVGERDILDIAETNQISSNHLLQLSSDHSNDILAAMETDEDGNEEHQTEIFCSLPSLTNSQGSLDETLGSWEMQLPKLFLASVHSPSPQQKYYRRKVF